MRRILLIARREYLAYARTVGFWLSLLALPIIGAASGGVTMAMMRSEPQNIVTIVDMTQARRAGEDVRAAIALDQETAVARALRTAALAEGGQEGVDRVRAASARGTEAGLAELRRVAPRAAQGFKPPRQTLTVVPAPEAAERAPNAEAAEALLRPRLDSEGADKLDAIVVLQDRDGAVAARVWSAKVTNNTVERTVREALATAQRNSVLRGAGLTPDQIQAMDRYRPRVDAFSPRAASGGQVSLRDRLPAVLGLVLALVLWSAVLTGASILLNSVMEEKANKVLEVLLSSASSAELLVGKVLGVALLTATVMGVWTLIGAVGTAMAFPTIAADVGSILVRDGLFVWLLLYLVGGYLMFASMFAAIGAFCETPREAQTLVGPIMMLLIIPIFVMQMAVRNPDAAMVKAASWVPFFTPFVMTARAPSGPPLIELIGTFLVMALTTVAVIWLAGRAFRAGALSTGKLDWRGIISAVRQGG